ncbi:MAG: class I tRNA ligase family protein [Patescibacteria group bacterium]
MKAYDFKKIEKKWRERWLQDRLYEPDLDNPKKPFYNLMMFPYPSAEGLHIGGVRTFTGVDIYGRFKRMQGHDVFQPMGLDGFGINSENYAIKIGEHPKKLALRTEENFYRQLHEIGNAFAWDEKLETYDPEYYRWTQWLFIQLFKAGLAYRKKASVNWCPKCLTVLANEQVIAGKCERCGTEVIQKELEQWFFKITKYAGRLLDGLDHIDWDGRITTAQRNWIGKSEGALITFPLTGIPGQEDGKHSVDVFTTRPDTLFGTTFLVISPETAKFWLDIGWQAPDEVRAYITKSLGGKEEERLALGKEKTGVFSGIYAINPATDKQIPVWVADYVLGGYGTGAIMAVPAHDERDFEFAKKFELPIALVIEPETGKIMPDEQHRRSIVAIVEDPKHKKFLTLNWGSKLGGTLFIGGGREEGEDEVATALREIQEETGYTQLEFVAKSELMHHHYFAFSKNVARNIEVTSLYFRLKGDERVEENLQHDEKGNFTIEWLTKDEVLQKMEDENHLLGFRRLVLGEIYSGDGILTNSGEFDGMSSREAKWKITEKVKGKQQTNYRLRDWLISRQRYWGPPIPMIWCDSCKEWISEKEENLPVLLPDVKEFRPTGTDKAPLANFPEFYETTCPKCGGKARRETDVSDTFLDSAWYYLRYLDPSNKKEFVSESRARTWAPVHSYIGGAEHSVLHLLYVRFVSMALHDLGFVDFAKESGGEPIKQFRAHGLITKDGAKMSKSRGNVINPDDYLRVYGADALRMYLAFMAPLTEGGDFQDTGIRGMVRFLSRVWDFKECVIDGESDEIAERAIAKAIKKVSEDMESLQFNTAISALMICLNTFEEGGRIVGKKDLKDFLKLLAPLAPHVADELFEMLGEKDSIHKSMWPTYDEALTHDVSVKLVIQVNGKMREIIEVAATITEQEMKERALSSEQIKKYINGQEPKNIIIVGNKLVNIVL